MNATDFFLTALSRAEATLRRSLEGLEPADLRAQPAGPGSNPIGWMVMHLTRVQDNILSRVQGKETEWDEGGWAAKFGISDDSVQWTPDNVHAFDPQSVETLLAFYEAVRERTGAFVASLSETDLDVEHPALRPGAPPMTLGTMLALILGDNVQHVGQVAFLRGVIKGQGWF
ncbi:MAG: DinB family protein [Chloroflexota bacterium]|nr:DinB family protein [Chloroflexota bacterium]